MERKESVVVIEGITITISGTETYPGELKDLASFAKRYGGARSRIRRLRVVGRSIEIDARCDFRRSSDAIAQAIASIYEGEEEGPDHDQS